MTQCSEGATVFASLAPSSGDAWPPAPCPNGPASDPSPAARPAAPTPLVLLPSAGPAAVCKHFLPPPHPELPSWRELGSQPGQRSQLPQLGSSSRQGRRGSARLTGSSHRGNPGARSCGRSLGKPKAWATGESPGALLPSSTLPARLRGCPGATGLSRRCLPTQLPMLALQTGPMQRRQRAGRRLRAPVPDGGVPGQRLRPPSIGRAPISPPAHSAPAPASPQTLPVRGEGGGRLPSTVPGGQAEAGVAHDGTRPETSSAEGAERGGGYRRSYSRLSQGSQLEPAPRSLSLTCLTPPQPGPASIRRLAVPAAPPPPPPSPGAHVTDGTTPSGRA